MSDIWLDTPDDEFIATVDDIFIDIDDLFLSPEAGSYIIAGSDATFLTDRRISAEAGSYDIAGSSILLILPVTLQVAAGSYLITGSEPFIWTTIFPVEAGVYLISSDGVGSVIGVVPESTENTIYLFTLTGAEDATTDIEIPIRSVQARLRSGTPTYLQIVIPGLAAAQAINDRPNGTMQVDIAFLKQGVISQRNNIIEANLEDIRIDEGPVNKSITLTGHKQETYTQKSITLAGQIYTGTINGETRYRFAVPNVYLHPGDEVTIGDDTFDANVISYFINARPGGMTTQMEISES